MRSIHMQHHPCNFTRRHFLAQSSLGIGGLALAWLLNEDNLLGAPESAGQYLKYCLQKCEWNTEVFKPKTADEKQKALAKLVASPKWKKSLTDEKKKVFSSQIE